MPKPTHSVRSLVIILGDQLDDDSAALRDFDNSVDALWMAEVAEESTHVWSHKARTAYFLSAMRHFRDRQQMLGRHIHYTLLDALSNRGSLAAELETAIIALRPQRLICVEPGDYRVRQALQRTAMNFGIPLEFRIDTHFFSTIDEFAEHAHGRKQLRMEFFYREMRKRTGYLMDDGKPVGGEWNYDADNRESFGKSGPGRIPLPMAFPADETTKAVCATIDTHFPNHPGTTASFDWPVTPTDAEAALTDFIHHRSANFGTYQDAMWTNEPWLYHSRISAAMNLKLLNPRKVLHAVESAYRAGRVPLAGAEGFIRQILGWREYVRGVYWHFMPDYAERNALNAEQPLPRFYWTGETEMNCLRQSLAQTLKLGYAHHIQRLMVTGLFALLLGVRPKAVHEWYLAVYVDAIEWVELPNTLGMSQYADGGIMASKPYIASGKYIERMSNYCKGCRYNPAESVGKDACPFTTLYWDFLMRHRELLKTNQRMVMQVRNLERLPASTQASIRAAAERLRSTLATSG